MLNDHNHWQDRKCPQVNSGCDGSATDHPDTPALQERLRAARHSDRSRRPQAIHRLWQII